MFHVRTPDSDFKWGLLIQAADHVGEDVRIIIQDHLPFQQRTRPFSEGASGGLIEKVDNRLMIGPPRPCDVHVLGGVH